jgi:hypothetical protein
VRDLRVLGRADAVCDRLKLVIDGRSAKAIEALTPGSCGYIRFLDGDTLLETVVGGDVAYLEDDNQLNGDSHVAPR